MISTNQSPYLVEFIQSTDLDFIHPIQHIEHLLEDFLQSKRQFQAHTTCVEQLQKVAPQFEDIVFPVEELKFHEKVYFEFSL